LVEVEPGAGRVLGLLSIAQLPRRLMLDFRDFFSRGFAFNRLGGRVRIADGLARSDDMAIEGPAADIHMRGRSDLRAQTHDQTIEVLPRTGNLLPAVGAIAGGPMGAAVGAVANAVLRKPLGGVGARTYRVTGPWKEPRVEVVEHPDGPQAAVKRDRPVSSEHWTPWAGPRVCAPRARPQTCRMDTTPPPLALAQSRLLQPAGLDPSGLDRMFGTLLGPGIDFGDIYFQHSRRESWSVEDGSIEDGAHSIEQGVG